MCRLLAIASRSRAAERWIRILIAGLIEASSYDPYLEEVSRNRRRSHSDGWGLAGLCIVDSDIAVLSYRSILPIYSEISRSTLTLVIEKLSGYDLAYLVLHSRALGRSEPYGVEYSHPYRVDTVFGAIWFAHNGSVDKHRLSQKLGQAVPWLYTDSQLLAMYIARSLERCVKHVDDLDSCVSEVYRESLEYVPKLSALNTALLILFRDSVHLYTSFYVNGWEECEECRKRYYQLYTVVKNGVAAIASSTLKLYVGRELEFNPLEQGVYSVEVERVRLVDRF